MKGEDFKNIFSPVAKLPIVRIVIVLATINNWPMCQLNINNAFLYGYLEEKGYMISPVGYDKALPRQVCRLRKSLYGLKRAARQWNKEMVRFLVSLGFVQSIQDYSLFIEELDGNSWWY